MKARVAGAPDTARAAAAVTESLLAAAWRENLDGMRQRARSGGDAVDVEVPGGRLRFGFRADAFDQISLREPPRLSTPHGHVDVDDPCALLRLLLPRPPQHLAAELDDAVTGLALASRRSGEAAARLADLARRRGATSLIDLAGLLRAEQPQLAACRLFEPLAFLGHHLHPCARTRLGWSRRDRVDYDVETPVPFGLRFVSAAAETVDVAADPQGRRLDQLLALAHPHLAEHLRDDRVLIPVHPWQHRHVLPQRAGDLYRSGDMVDVPQARLSAVPTASVRTLVVDSGTYLKCSLDIRITSTRRGVSPATAANGPALSTILREVIDSDPATAGRLTLLAEPAAVSLPDSHPARRDLTCVLREPLHHVASAGELPVPAATLSATSPVSGDSVMSELLRAHARGGGTPETFLRGYADVLIAPCLRLAAAYGVGLEAHLQNCVPTFVDGRPRRMIVRDLGGLRLHRPRMRAAGLRPGLHPKSVVDTDDVDVMRAKVAYTVFQNHFAAVAAELRRLDAMSPRRAWRIAADAVAEADVPAADRAFYTAATVPHKALLTMRLDDDGDRHVPVSNPLHRALGVDGHEVFGDAPQPRREVPHPSRAPHQVALTRHAQIGQHRLKPRRQLLGQARRVGAQDLVAARERGDHPKHRLAVVAGGDQVAAAVDDDRPRPRRNVGAEEKRGARRGGGRVERVLQRVQVTRHARRRHIRQARQLQQLAIHLVAAVRGQRPPRGQVAKPHRRVAQCGGEHDVRGDAGAEQPRGDLVRPRSLDPDAVQAVFDGAHRALAATPHPLALSEARRDVAVHPSQQPGRVGDDRVDAEASGQVMRRQHRFGIVDAGTRQVGRLQQRAVVVELPGLERRGVRVDDDHDVHVGGRRQAGVVAQPDRRAAEVRAGEPVDACGVLLHPPCGRSPRRPYCHVHALNFAHDPKGPHAA
ncbi:MAG: IucA/IucC family protein [Stackebrandtia sp.]